MLSRIMSLTCLILIPYILFTLDRVISHPGRSLGLRIRQVITTTNPGNSQTIS